MSTVVFDTHGSNKRLATRRDVEKLRADLQRDMAGVKADMLKWIAGMLVAQGAVVATLVRLL